MKLSLLGLAMLSIGLSVAAPSPAPKGPPGPPPGTVGKASQSCGNSISLSSLHCCDQSSSNKAGSAKSKKVVKDKSGSAYDMQCSAINTGDEAAAVSSVCSVTVACCYGDGCIAIAY